MKQQTRPRRDGQQPPIWFSPLTGFRQVGTHQQRDDGTTTYVYAAMVSKDMSPIQRALTISPDLTLHVSATFNETVGTTMRAEGTA
jgi:hypothetical protein